MSTAAPETIMSSKELEDLFNLPAYENDKGYRLVFLDDDKTPMDAVVLLFILIFRHQEDKAMDLMLTIHERGRAGVFEGTEEECQAKQAEADLFMTSLLGWKLFSLIEKVED